MSNIRQRLQDLQLELPPAPAPVAAYVNCVQSGNLVFVSGGLPILGDKKIIGKLGDSIDIETGREASRMIILNRLAVLEAELGDLDRITRIVSLNGFVNSTAEFDQHPQVINGASELLGEIFGDAGKHSRTAVGVNSLPFDVAVEINLTVEVK